MSMNIISGVTTWDDVAAYIDDTMGISYTDNPTSWTEAMYELTKGYKYVKTVNDVTGEVTSPLYSEAVVNGVGEFHTNSAFSSSSTISGGGVKTLPTAKSIITENTGGGTAVITDNAIGIKDIGISSYIKGISVIGGLLQTYGLICTGIKIANAQVWKDMSNYVYDSDFTEDTPVERVIEFLTNKVVNSVTDLTSDGDIRVNIPDSIAQKLYDFLSNHMVEEQTPGIHPMMEAFDLIYNFIQRTLVLSDPDHYTLERYRSATNPTDTNRTKALDITDDLFKAQVQNFIEQAIGSGFNIASSVATALLAAMDGTMDYLKTQSVDAVDEATIQTAEVLINRGYAPPTKDTPVSLSEFEVYISCLKDEKMPYTEIEGDIYYDINLDTARYDLPSLAPGYSYQNGDCVKYLQRGKNGTDPNDYAYIYKFPAATGSGDTREWGVAIRFPANEKVMAYHSYGTGSLTQGCTNGFPANNYGDYTTSVSDEGLRRDYSNLGYSGYGVSYMPDDYLVTAGIRSKTDTAGNPEVHPNPNKTKEQVYPQLDNKKQVANPQARVESGAVIVDNQIIGYVPTSIPFGSSNADRIIQHGINNPDDPYSYTDNRPQNDKASGFVNTDDPIEGFNEDVSEAIDQYNDTRQDPAHYPEPIPENETNPQYPTNPPADTTGDTGSNPDPATGTTGVTASGMVSVYNPTKQEVIDFSAWLWSPNFFDNFIKLLQNPLEAIIGLHVMYATPVTGSPEHIVVGYLDSGVSAKVVTQQYFEISCGSVTVPEYYGTAIDYEPYTTVHLYLPFVGIQAIKANDVIGKKVTVKYGIDTLTGACLAMVTTEKGDSKIQCYTFPGNCAVQIPLTGGNYAQVIRSIASVAVGVAGSLLTANPLPAIGGVVAGAMGSSFDVSHSGSLGSNVGVMGVRKPYLIITRRSGYDAGGYNQYYGYPANKTVVLGTCQGYTRVKSVHIETIGKATDSEKSEMETLLKQGVIIK